MGEQLDPSIEKLSHNYLRLWLGKHWSHVRDLEQSTVIADHIVIAHYPRRFIAHYVLKRGRCREWLMSILRLCSCLRELLVDLREVDFPEITIGLPQASKCPQAAVPWLACPGRPHDCAPPALQVEMQIVDRDIFSIFWGDSLVAF